MTIPDTVLETLTLTDFRVFAAQTFAFAPERNRLTGRNGAGKSSVVEAVVLLSTGRSFRAGQEREMIRFGCAAARIELSARAGDRRFTLGMELCAGKKKRVLLDGTDILPRELPGILPVVLFAPDDRALVADGPAERRRYLDIALSQCKPRYLLSLCRYRKIWEEKTRVLRRAAEQPSYLSLLPDYDRQLADVSAVLSRERAAFLAEMDPLACGYYAAVADGAQRLTLRFRSHALDADELFALLCAKRAMEVEQRVCLYGAHKDDIDIALDGRPARDYASQGQVKTIALSVKLAERDLLRETLGVNPILLLDDVLSELDDRRRDYVLSQLRGGQLLLTSANGSENLTWEAS